MVMLSRIVINNRASAQRSDRRSDEFLRLMASLPVGVMHTDADGMCVVVNKRWSDITGFELDQARNNGWTRICRTRGTPREIVASWLRSGASGGIAKTVYPIVTNGRGRRIISEQVSAVHAVEASICGFLAAFEDITESFAMQERLQDRTALFLTDRVRAVQHLLDSETKYSQLFSAMIEGFALVEAVEGELGSFADFRYLDMNPAMERILGVPRSKVVGKREREIHQEADASWIALVAEIAGGGAPRHIERYLRFADKHIAGNLYSPEKGQCVMVVADVTAQRAMEAEQIRLEDQLAYSRKMEAVGQLAGGIAHDFNNILTSVISNTFILKKRFTHDEAASEFLHAILSEAGRAAGLTKGLLQFSRRNTPSLSPVSLNDLVGKVKGALQKQLGEHIVFALHLFDEETMVMADTAQFEQVLAILVGNAHDAVENGGKIAIETSCRAADGDFLNEHGFDGAEWYAEIAVTDTGSGIPPEILERIFEPFFTTKPVGKGSGLGLAIAYGIVKQHHGHIKVKSAEGAGTKFSIYLPVADQSMCMCPSDSTES
ncbi:MAG TPA: ATP-binding protein [Dissulfurispiraceae bacterium]|nr:ATP-binding protein [Dissulfurispiraceae bacterium]